MAGTQFDTQLMRFGERQNIKELRALVNKSSTRELTTALSAKLGRSDCIMFWSHLLQAFDLKDCDEREKRFACVKCFMDGLLKVELSYKQTYDMISRLCQDLATFSSTELIIILEHCMDGMRAGDPKCVSWKDLLPETLKVLAVQQQINVNGVVMSGTEFRNSTVRNLCTMRWPTPVLTPIADMFRNLDLSNTETLTVINKFANDMMDLSPMELPALAYQIFSNCYTASHIVIPILAFEKYFHRHYYKKLFSDMSNNSTDFNSIDAYSDKELREAEETILHHLNDCTQYKMSETQLLIVFRNFVNMPDVILTPFVLSAIICMTASNRDPDYSRLFSSILLPFLRTVIKHNEEERTLADYSVWCRDTLQRKQVDLEQVFTVLINQNKEGKDVITPGLVNLAFMLLKARQSPTLNSIAIGFLTKFIRKRFVFGQGIVKRIAKWMIVEQEQYQYSECLTMLSVADTFTVAECVDTTKDVMDNFLWVCCQSKVCQLWDLSEQNLSLLQLPGEHALRMMSFILPLLKLSIIVRDALIEVLRKAMNSNEDQTRLMAVYGFCMILKQLNNSNSQCSSINSAGFCTQHSISGFSLITQSSFGRRSNPQRNFDMLTLEIIGLLRNCFSQSMEIKCTLYENLQRAVEINPKLVPHVLQFIDWHFRYYFNAPVSDELDDEPITFSIHYELLVTASDDHQMELTIKENLGYLIQFVAHCLMTIQRFAGAYDTQGMRHLLNTAIERIVTKELTFEDTSGPATHLKCALVQQQLNILEGLISFALLSSTKRNEIVKNILPLFKQHRKLYEGLKSLASSAKKSQKRPKNPNDNDTTAGNLTINGVVVKKINTEVENIWDLGVIEKLLRLLHEDIVPFAASEHTSALRSHTELVRYVLEVAAHKVEAIRLEPEYKQLAHSKRTLNYLTDITKVIYERCIKQLPTLWRDFDMKTAANASHCFMQCLKTANEIYKKRFKDSFVKGFDLYVISQSKESPYVVQDIIDAFMLEDASAQSDDDVLLKDPIASQIPQYLLESLEVLYDNIGYDNRVTIESYTWLFHFCQTYEIHNESLTLVHKLLFIQRQKTHSGAFFSGIAQLLGKVLGTVIEEDADNDDDNDNERSTREQLDFQLKSITKGSAFNCLQYLYASLHKQIEDVDYFIVKANNLNFKCGVVSENDRTFQRASLDALQRAICTQLIHVSKTLFELTNVCIPLGTSMDGLMRLIVLHYGCLKNLAKHFLTCSTTTSVSIKSTKFDLLLLVVGKPLPTNIYALIKYIEENIIEDKKRKKINPQAEKAKVLRETKLIPKIILSIENFNKHVILLDKKTTHGRLAKMLHFGTVRDFRIKTDDLKAAIERTYSHSKDIKIVESDLGDAQPNEVEVIDLNESILARIESESRAMAGEDIENEQDQDGDDNDADDVDDGVDENASAVSNAASGVHTRASKAKKRTTRSSSRRQLKSKHRVTEIDENSADEENCNSSATTPTPENLRSTATDPAIATQLHKNLAKINKRSKRAGRSAKK